MTRGKARRSRLTLGAVLLVYVAVTGCSNNVHDSSLSTNTQGTQVTASPTAEEASTAATIGLRRYKLSELGSDGIESWVVGPRTLVLETRKKDESGVHEIAVVASSVADPWRTSISLPAGNKVKSQMVAAELDVASDPAAAQAILSDEAGSGLATSHQVLTVAIADAGTASVNSIRYELPTPENMDGSAHLAAVTMANGVVVCALEWRVSVGDERQSFVHRVAFSSEGKELWSRTDDGEKASDRSGSLFGQVGVDPSEMTAAGETVVFGVGDQLVGMNILTGAELYRVPAPYSGGIAFTSANLFGLDVYTSGGYGNGIGVFQFSDGTSFDVGNARNVAVDPVTGLTAVAYQVEDGGSNDAPNTPGTPALEVLDGNGVAVFTVDRDQAATMGQPNVVGAFDGRMILGIADGIRVVSLSDGTAEPGFEAVPPGAFRITNVPFIASPYLVMLSSTNGYGDTERDFVTSVILSDQELTWNDLDVKLYDQ